MSIVNSPEVINDPFARVLVFYHRYFRVRINEQDLIKVARKYKSKPKELIDDLAKKYPDFPIPENVFTCDLLRIHALFSLPKIYTDIYGASLSGARGYDAKVDVFSRDFNAEVALGAGTLLARNRSTPPLDNMSKVQLLFFNEDGQLKSSGDAVNAVMHSLLVQPSINRAKRDELLAANPQSSETLKHPFTLMMEAAVPTITFRDDNGVVHSHDSPMVLLKTFVEHKQRVRVVVRRKACIRGSVDGFLKAFDRHFNLLLTDADEVYITNSQKRRRTRLGVFVCENNTLRRHLPQLIIRGDNVVSIFPKP